MNTGILVFLVFAIIALWVAIHRNDRYAVSSIDNEAYIVRDDYYNKQNAADILARVNVMYVRLIKHLKKNKLDSEWRNHIKYLADNYNPDVIGEHIPWSTNYTSYVERKGKKVRFCLRTSGDRNKLHDLNTIKFVAIHELAHMMTYNYGHDDEFWSAFAFLLKEAESIGEIVLINYRYRPQPYCGISINRNPAFERWW